MDKTKQKPKMLRRSYDGYALKAAEQPADEGRIRFRITEKKVDRHGEVVIPDGIVLDNFKANPVVCFAHDRWSPSVGKVDLDSFKITPKFVDTDVIFDLEDPFANLLHHKYKEGFLNAVSIGFRNIETSEAFILPNQTGRTIKKWELLELSLVPLPALPSAIAQRKSYAEEFVDFRAECERLGYWRKELKDLIIPEIDEKAEAHTISDEEQTEMIAQNIIIASDLQHYRKSYIETLRQYGQMKEAYIASLRELGQLKQKNTVTY